MSTITPGVESMIAQTLTTTGTGYTGATLALNRTTTDAMVEPQ